MAVNYYEQIDDTLKKQVEEALLSIDAQEKAALLRFEDQRKTAYSTLMGGLSGAYSDYAAAVNPYGVNNENLYSGGIGNSGKSETAKAAYYNAYTELIGSLKDTYSKEITEIGLNEEDMRAKMLGLRTDVNTDAYNKLLEELIRRQNLEREDSRFEYEKQQDERDYNFKVERANKEDEKDQRDFDYKVEQDTKNYELKAGSVSNKATSTNNKTETEEAPVSDLQSPLEIDIEKGFGTTGMLSDSDFERLKNIFLYLTYSVLPGETNPTPRIRRTKENYLKIFKNRLTSQQFMELVQI